MGLNNSKNKIHIDQNNHDKLLSLISIKDNETARYQNKWRPNDELYDQYNIYENNISQLNKFNNKLNSLNEKKNKLNDIISKDDDQINILNNKTILLNLDSEIIYLENKIKYINNLDVNIVDNWFNYNLQIDKLTSV